jgi:alpha-glucosidase
MSLQMKNLKLVFGLFISLLLQIGVQAQKSRMINLISPNGRIHVAIVAGKSIQWSLTMQSQTILSASTISLQLKGGEVLGREVEIRSIQTSNIKDTIHAFDYKKDIVDDRCSQLILNCKGDYGIIFRAYDEGVAYRFFTKRKGSIVIEQEEADFNFTRDDSAYIAYVNDPHDHDIYETSFENNYQHIPLSGFVKDTIAFAPVLVELENGKKSVITEADLEDYPGMFLESGSQPNSLRGRFAPAVESVKPNPHNDAQSLVAKRADFIAKTDGTRSFPWRIFIVSDQDKELLNNDMVYRLASPSRLKDLSWIKAGKVAWDWWNDWNISHVDFRAGVNTATYKYYIDFAASSHIEYILLDAGWSDGKDIMKIVPEVNLQQIIDYGKSKGIGVWLWSGSAPMNQKMAEALSTYSKMGIKGFKIDFMDRDDQQMVQFYYQVAGQCAANRLMLDFHGAYKPTGLQRTFPNVVNFEGVRGLENTKWSNTDFPLYDVTIPYIRMVSGPMDYTPGAMKNANKANFRAINSAPMSQGTRCHQIAMYIMYEAPFEMLSDNPTNYLREPESLKFISSIPTVFDQTIALDGKVGEYAVLARQRSGTWYAAAMGNWDQRDIILDLSFLGPGTYEAEIFKDGINADREATDFKQEWIKLSGKDKLPIHLSTGGGWAGIFRKTETP